MDVHLLSLPLSRVLEHVVRAALLRSAVGIGFHQGDGLPDGGHVELGASSDISVPRLFNRVNNNIT